MKTIDTYEQLVKLLDDFKCANGEVILRVYDNKSDVLLQSIIVKHPILFIRGIQDFCKTVNLPVSDVSVRFVGMIDEYSCFTAISEIVEISPYVYFNKPKEEAATTQDD